MGDGKKNLRSWKVDKMPPTTNEIKTQLRRVSLEMLALADLLSEYPYKQHEILGAESIIQEWGREIDSERRKEEK